MIIVPGQSNIVVKTGCIFSMASDDRVFTGDLNFDCATEEFVMRGIPSTGGQMDSILPKTEKGPYKLMLFVEQVRVSEVRPSGQFIDFRFRKAKCSYEFGVFIEEWSNHPLVMKALENHWSFAPNLVWTR